VKPLPTNPNTDELKTSYFRKYFTVSQLRNLTKNFSILKNIDININNSVRFSMLKTYINSYDNLVLDLYNKDLLELPVRLSTLSFYKFKSDATGGMSPDMRQLLDESYLSTKEKFKRQRFAIN